MSLRSKILFGLLRASRGAILFYIAFISLSFAVLDVPFLLNTPLNELSVPGLTAAASLLFFDLDLDSLFTLTLTTPKIAGLLWVKLGALICLIALATVLRSLINFAHNKLYGKPLPAYEKNYFIKGSPVIILLGVFLLAGYSDERSEYGFLNIFGVAHLIGLHEADASMNKFMELQGEKPKINGRYGDQRWSHYLFERNGMELYFLDARLNAIHWFPGKTMHKMNYKGTLPAGLRAEDNKQSVIKTLGAPTKSGGSPTLPYWDTWEQKNYQLNIEYDDDDGIAMLSICDNQPIELGWPCK